MADGTDDIIPEGKGGESQGGAYPNAHAGKKPEGGGFMGHGGQSDMAYHGSGQLGSQRVGDETNPNAPAGSAAPEADEAADRH